MKKVLSILLCVVSVLVFCAFPFGMAFASEPVSWDDVGEDAIALRDSYYELWSSSGNFSQLFKSAADIPVKWLKTLADGALALSPIDDLFFTYEDAVPVVQSGTPKGKDWISKHGITSDTPVISSDDLSSKIEELNQDISPKSRGLFLNSYRTDTYYFEGTTKYDYFSVPIFCLYQDPSSHSSLEDLYVIPFYLDDEGTYYYLKYQLHLYYTDFSSEVGSLALRCDVYRHSSLGYVLDDSLSGDVLYCSADTKPYQVRALVKSQGSTFRYVSESEYNSLANTHIASVPFDELGYFYTADESQSLFISDLAYECYACFKQFYKNNKYKNNDLGFICSTDMISTTYSDIDTTKIPANQIVTINGDTIYEYNITNPETGDSSKFGDYITNNYTYITNNYGGESGGSSGSGVGGNVTVGGKIDVGGSVDVNINVNGGAGGNGIANPDDFTSADEVDLTKYYDNAVEQSTGFQKFLKDFFGFLPAELLALILFAVAMAIVCRVFGR